jgi:hypothetical protein
VDTHAQQSRGVAHQEPFTTAPRQPPPHPARFAVPDAQNAARQAAEPPPGTHAAAPRPVAGRARPATLRPGDDKQRDGDNGRDRDEHEVGYDRRADEAAR